MAHLITTEKFAEVFRTSGWALRKNFASQFEEFIRLFGVSSHDVFLWFLVEYTLTDMQNIYDVAMFNRERLNITTNTNFADFVKIYHDEIAAKMAPYLIPDYQSVYESLSAFSSLKYNDPESNFFRHYSGSILTNINTFADIYNKKLSGVKVELPLGVMICYLTFGPYKQLVTQDMTRYPIYSLSQHFIAYASTHPAFKWVMIDKDDDWVVPYLMNIVQDLDTEKQIPSSDIPYHYMGYETSIRIAGTNTFLLPLLEAGDSEQLRKIIESYGPPPYESPPPTSMSIETIVSMPETPTPINTIVRRQPLDPKTLQFCACIPLIVLLFIILSSA